jgi:hypothetical protein
MGTLMSLLGYAAGIGGLVCYILVIIEMFKRQQTSTAVLCLVLLLVCGLGGLIAFVYGWINAKNWGIQNIMMAWTGCFAVSVICNGISIAMGAAAFPGMGR